MSKQITPEELAEIVTKLLTDPNEIDDSRMFAGFFTRTAELVCEFCGGGIAYDADNSAGEWLIGIHRNECSPENGGIWANYDKEGDLWC